jgi:hypothetical protein
MPRCARAFFTRSPIRRKKVSLGAARFRALSSVTIAREAEEMHYIAYKETAI